MSAHSIKGKPFVRSDRTQPLRVALVASSLRLAGAEKQTVYMAQALIRVGIDLQFFYLGGGGHYETVLRQSGVPIHRIHTPNQPWIMLAGLTRALCCNALVLGGVRSDGIYELNAHGRVSRWIARLAHGLVANSRRARQNLVCRGVSPQKIEVLPNVIDLDDFDERSALPAGVSLPSDRIIVAAVGSLHPCKRLDRFLEALAVARRSEPALTGVIAGADCGAKAELQARANALGLSPLDLAFLGEVDRVPALLARAAMLILSSDYEGFPNVILEAMAAQLPVISTPAGDAGVIVQDGKTGYVVEAEDVRGMAAFMVQLAQSPSARRSFGEAGRKRVEHEYNFELLAERLVAIFHRFASRQQRSSLCELLEHGALAINPEAIPNSLMLG
jgi:glycosyltransferase involved in cell wall biosynthesis